MEIGFQIGLRGTGFAKGDIDWGRQQGWNVFQVENKQTNKLTNKTNKQTNNQTKHNKQTTCNKTKNIPNIKILKLLQKIKTSQVSYQSYCYINSSNKKH